MKKLSKRKLFYLICILVAILAVFAFSQSFNNGQPNSQIKISEDKPTWNTYINYDYGFAIDFPTDWKVDESFEEVSLSINIYLPEKNIQPPFDLFSEVNNVSIFPRGLQTSAIIGQSQKTDVDFDFESDEAIDYILEDGTVWATYISFDELQDPWKPWGFLWSKTVVDGIEYKCLDGSIEIDLDTCSPLVGDEFVRIGQVDPETRKIQEEIIASFRFLEQK